MTINSRQKGAAFERHICKLLNDLLVAKGHEGSVKRNLEQYQTKGMADLYFKNFAIECKRYKERSDDWPMAGWWKQTVEAAGDKYIPILIFKYDRRETHAVVPLGIFNPALEIDTQQICVTSLRHFLEIAEAQIADLI